MRDVYKRLPDEDPKAKQPGVCVENCVRQRTDLWMQPKGGKSITLKCWRLEDFPEARRLRAISSAKTWRPTFSCTGMFFSWWVEHKGRRHARSLLRGACELSKVVTLTPPVVAVTDYELLGQNTDVATVRNRVRARRAARFPCLEGSGADRC